ncbi:MAG: NAD(P)H-dependent oxidoreductase subunit E [bacterium]|nr:NAD(P)H-dependent oxidoreductase subunit E [bacterium]
MQINNIIQKYGTKKEALISILQDIQLEYNWLPCEAITEVANKLGVPLINVYGVATFFKQFSLKPRGKHIVTVCLGTAETVNCLGCCAIGPIMVVDGEYYGGMTSAKVKQVVKKYLNT